MKITPPKDFLRFYCVKFWPRWTITKNFLFKRWMQLNRNTTGLVGAGFLILLCAQHPTCNGKITEKWSADVRQCRHAELHAYKTATWTQWNE